LSDVAEPDPSWVVGLVVAALAFGAALGVGLQGLVTWTVRTLQQQGEGPAAQGPPALGSPPALVLLLGSLAGIVAAGAAAWWRLKPIGNPWRQAMLGIVAGIGSFVLSLVTLPIDRAFGRSGLLVLVAVSLLASWLIARRIPRAPSLP